jgi:hypothetical protein
MSTERLTKPLVLASDDRIPDDTRFVLDPSFAPDPRLSYSAVVVPEGVRDVRFGRGCSIESEWEDYPKAAWSPALLFYASGLELRGACEGLDLDDLAVRRMPNCGVYAMRGGAVGVRWVGGRVEHCRIGVQIDWPQTPRRPHSDWDVRRLTLLDTWGYDTDDLAMADPDGIRDAHSGARSLHRPGGWVGHNQFNADLRHSRIEDLVAVGESHTALKLLAPHQVTVRRARVANLWLGPTQYPYAPLWQPVYAEPRVAQGTVVEDSVIDPQLGSIGLGQTVGGNTVQCSGPTEPGHPIVLRRCTIYVPRPATNWQSDPPRRAFQFAAVQAAWGCEVALEENLFVVRGEAELRPEQIVDTGRAGEAWAGKVNADWMERNRIVYAPDEGGPKVPERRLP